MHPVTAAVTARIADRSRETRADYLDTGSLFKFDRATATQSIVYKALPWARLFANASENHLRTICGSSA